MRLREGPFDRFCIEITYGDLSSISAFAIGSTAMLRQFKERGGSLHSVSEISYWEPRATSCQAGLM